jgi:hypothetical protein
MRACGGCKKPDAPWLEDAPCNCGVPPTLAGDANEHRPECRALGHEVVFYPVRLTKADLWFDEGAKPHISAYYTGRGWTLKQDGNKLYRVKLLCRDCIGLEVGAQARKREYESACKRARGDETQTYAQMLASQ